MRRCCCLILVLFLFAPVAAADGDSRPVVEAPTYAGEASDQLRARRREARLAARRTAAAQSENQRVVTTTLDQYLMLAETLLNRGDRIGGVMGSRMVIIGTTMLEGHAAVEAVLRPFATGVLPEADSTRVRRELVEFSQGVRAGLSTVPMSATGDLDGVVIGLIMPLRNACEITAGRPAPHGWWSVPITKQPARPADDLDEAMATLDLDEALLAQLGALKEHESLRAPSMNLMASMASHKWMGGLAKRAVRQSLQAALKQVNEADGSPQQFESRVAALQELIDAIGRFAASPGGRAVASRRSEAIVDVMEAWPGGLPPEAPSLAIAASIDVLAEARAQEGKGLERLRARTHGVLAGQRMMAERRVFEAFGEVARSDAPWTDPALVVILSEPRQLLEAMQRLRRLDTWLAAAEQVSPNRTSEFTTRMEGLVSAMTDHRSREDSARALREFERQFEMFLAMDGETSLSGSPFDPGGGITRGIRQARSQWFVDWSQGRSAGEGANNLYRFRRFLDCMLILEQVDEAGLERLDAWSAWELPIDRLRARRELMQERLIEIATALVAGDGEAADRYLRRLEDSFAVLLLAGVVLHQAPPPPQEEPALVILGEVTSRPGASSLLAAHRDTLAQLGHALLEIEALSRQERVEEAEMLHLWSVAEAVRILRRLDFMPAAPLAVPGMRDGEADIAGEGMEMMR